MRLTATREGTPRALGQESLAEGLPQFNAQVVNLHLARHKVKARRLARAMRRSVVARWVDKLSGYARGAPWRYLIEMDEVLERSYSCTC